jgi:GT2 family glycosyltransferase
VVVPSRGLDALLRHCLLALHAALQSLPDGVATRVVVVDNASPVPYRPGDVAADRVLRLDRHHSFAAACNLGTDAADADATLVLNNDVLLDPAAIASMLAHLDDPVVGIVGARLVYPDATIQHRGVALGPDGPYHPDRGRPSASVDRRSGPLQAVTGAALLVRRETLASVDGFDEAYPFGLEDIDLCLRARQVGWAVVCDQSVDSLHFESMTPGRAELDTPSRELFRRRWHGAVALDPVALDPAPAHPEHVEGA